MLGAILTLQVRSSIASDSIDYVREIKPLLREKCFACHGAWKQEGGLRLDTASNIQKGGDSGTTIDLKKPETSLLLERVSTAEVSERMPLQATPLTSEQISKLRTWIEQGAPSPPGEVPDKDPRDHWSFRIPQRSALPTVKGAGITTHPIDAFVAAGHSKRGLSAAPTAQKTLLLRRIYLDLIGLPPTVEQLKSFLADESPDAYQRVVDQLLTSPRYGERWGRHWMDIWRYADWYGRRIVPDVWNSAPQIWRWRDWIVRSLNEDKGYDQMVAEMLAADEIAPEDDDAVVATGYLIRNWYALNPNDWMRQNVEHTAKAFLGLTFNCAHCHDHKYDPITQQDYFALRAFFEPIGIRQDRVAGEADPGPFQEYSYSVLRKIVRLGAVRVYDKSPEAPTWFYTGGDERNRVKEKGSIAPSIPAVFSTTLEIRPVEFASARAYYPGSRPSIQATELQQRQKAVEQRKKELDATAAEAELAVNGLQPAAARDYEDFAARRAIESEEWKVQIAKAKLAAEQAELSSIEARIAADRAKYGEIKDIDPEGLAKIAQQAERLVAVRQAEAAYVVGEQMLAAAEAKAATDAERAKNITAANTQISESLTKLAQARADQANAKPSEYTALSPVYAPRSTGRRRALAQWLGSRQNPLTARVAVNHSWMRHFSAPLVASVFDFGLNGSPPTHPELLDWLAVELMESGWSMKHIHRLIVTSEAYRMASSHPDAEKHAQIDPENRYLWRQNVGRMEAEVVRDSILAAYDNLNLEIGGQELENEQALTTYRRSLYYSCQPELDGKSEFGAIFDAPDALECYRRTRSVIPQQALALSNSSFVHQASSAMSERIWSSLAPEERLTPIRFISSAFETVLSRPPLSAELMACQDYLDRQHKKHNKTFADDSQARASLVRVLLNHNDFVSIR